MQNEPNIPSPTSRRLSSTCYFTKQTQFVPQALQKNQKCKTILSSCPKKQTQFTPHPPQKNQKSKTILSSCLKEQTQFQTHPTPCQQISQNKPNLPHVVIAMSAAKKQSQTQRYPPAKCAKQTQFRHATLASGPLRSAIRHLPMKKQTQFEELSCNAKVRKTKKQTQFQGGQRDPKPSVHRKLAKQCPKNMAIE